METIETLFGNRLRELRNRRNWSQEELAFRCNVSKNYISDVERGKRNVSLRAIEKIARGLEVEIYELFYRSSQ
ncbi:helix-turn-helix domain-containing protein [Beduini massiliensis]|uniref:helix-turn-helix domain-containing protein n=1 Tax=Beduini massiliensis TaxID=1585974 RepID=UPI00059A9A02|nr:helix-turn-helix transcriptional regulator [Beduini massiliensis]